MNICWVFKILFPCPQLWTRQEAASHHHSLCSATQGTTTTTTTTRGTPMMDWSTRSPVSLRPRMKNATGGRPNLLRKRSLLLAATTYLTVFLTVLATTGVTVALAQEQAATTTTTTTTPQQDAVQADCSAELASIASLKATVSSYETSTGELEKKLVEITTKTLAEADKNVKELSLIHI